MSTQRRCVDKVVRQESVGSDALAAFVLPLDAFESRGKDDCLCAPRPCARVSIQLGRPQRYVGVCGSTSTFLLVCRTTCWRRKGQCTSRERRMAMLAGVRSLHARPWERRYRHAFGGWFERGRLNLRAGERSRFSEIAGKSPGESVGDSEDAVAPFLRRGPVLQAHTHNLPIF